MQKQRKNNQEKMGQEPGGIFIAMSSAGTEAPTQVEDECVLEHHRPVTSPPTHQKKVTHPPALTSNFAYKTFTPKTTGDFVFAFEHKPPILLAPPCSKPFLCFSLFGLTVPQAHEFLSGNRGNDWRLKVKRNKRPLFFQLYQCL